MKHTQQTNICRIVNGSLLHTCSFVRKFDKNMTQMCNLFCLVALQLLEQISSDIFICIKIQEKRDGPILLTRL